MEITGSELVKRIARLVRQNQDLVRENEELKERLRSLNSRVEELSNNFSQNDHDLPLQKNGNSVSRKFDMATVMIADVYGFNKLKEDMDSEAMMDQLDEIFFQFDNILKKHGMVKIKTFGDSTMAAGGIPEKNITNPVQVVLAAIEMQKVIEQYSQQKSKTQNIWDLKISIHTGPVTATTSGKKKLNYDIKGDTVNIASRMQSFTPKGEVFISVMTYELIKEFFICEYFGKMPVKYKDDLELFSVSSLRPEYVSEKDENMINKEFEVKYKLIQFTDIQEIILDKLEKELPPYLYYHNVKHTVDVVTEVELIGWAEGVPDEDILLLKTAALFHDAGHTISYDDHEFHGTVIAREILPSYGYNRDQIEKICELIMATKLPPKPRNLLEKIICDADLDYLGRSDMIPVSNTLYNELKEQNKINSFDEWNNLQIKFITGHQYFTETARNLREVNKQKQIERIRQTLSQS